jgi:hypothetical protein
MGLLPATVFGQTQVTLDDLNRQVQSLQAQKDNYDYLKQEMAEYRQFLEKQQEEQQKSLQLYYTIILGGLGLLVGFFIFMLGKTRRDVEKQLKTLYENYALEVWGEKSTRLNERIKRQERILALETNYKNARVLVVVSTNDQKFVKDAIEEPLNERGITDILPVTELNDEIVYEIKKERFDVIIRYYNLPTGSESVDEAMNQLVDLVIDSKIHTPLIVYTYRTEQMSKKDRDRILDYRYAVAANFPITLVDYVTTAVSMVKDAKLG